MTPIISSIRMTCIMQDVKPVFLTANRVILSALVNYRSFSFRPTPRPGVFAAL